MRISRPRYLFDSLNEVRRNLYNGERVVLFLDFDATLASLTKRPGLATLDAATRTALQSLAESGLYRVVIVSGRSLHDLKRGVALPNLIYAGNHGLEISGPAMEFVHDDAVRAVPLVTKACRTLKRTLRGVKGIHVESKRLTATIHYRLVPAHQAARVRLLLDKAIAPVVQRDLFVT
jgi:trehalose 6-phosphate phosphatase